MQLAQRNPCQPGGIKVKNWYRLPPRLVACMVCPSLRRGWGGTGITLACRLWDDWNLPQGRFHQGRHEGLPFRRNRGRPHHAGGFLFCMAVCYRAFGVVICNQSEQADQSMDKTYTPPQDFHGDPYARPPRQPVFNLPGVIVAALSIMVMIEAMMTWVLGRDGQIAFYIEAAFIPLRYGPAGGGADGAWFWSPVTYSLLHGGWLHLVINSFWLAAFGSVVARRIGTVRFIIFWVLSAIAASLFFLMFHIDEPVTMVGASGVVSALMAAAARFSFQRKRGFNRLTGHLNPRLSVAQSLGNRSVVTFLAVWFGINALAAFGFAPGSGLQGVAWEAHVGGFLFGFLTFGLFDPLPQGQESERLHG